MISMEKIKVYIEDRQDKLKPPTGLRLLLRRTCTAVLVEEKFAGKAEVSISFVDDEQIRALNKEYRGKDIHTDVLSFPLSPDGEHFDVDEETGAAQLGDIVISLERADVQAKAYNHSFQREMAFLTVHSMLHLLGYDHEDDAEAFAPKGAVRMREKEETILERLGLSRDA